MKKIPKNLPELYEGKYTPEERLIVKAALNNPDYKLIVSPHGTISTERRNK